MNDTVVCGLNAEQLMELKRKYGKLYLVTVTDGDEESAEQYNAICREQTQEVASMCSTVAKTDEGKAFTYLFNNVVLVSDEAIKQRDTLKVKVVEALNVAINKITATAKKL